MQNKLFNIVLVVLLITLVGCQSTANNLEVYKKAVKKTSTIQKGKISQEFQLQNSFNLEALSSERVAQLENYKNIYSTSVVTFDDLQNKQIVRNYLKISGFGFDTSLYKNGNKVFIKLPVIYKYLVLNELLSKKVESEKTEYFMEYISAESLTLLKEKWISLLQKKNNLIGKEATVKIADGNIKVKRLDFNIPEDKAKEFIVEAVNILWQDKILIQNIEERLRELEINKETLVFDNKSLNEIKKVLDKCSIKSFQHSVSVDNKGYIIQEDNQIEIQFPNAESGNLCKQEYSIKIKRWDIGREQSFDFPVLTAENILKLRSVNKVMSEILQKLFRVNIGGNIP